VSDGVFQGTILAGPVDIGQGPDFGGTTFDVNVNGTYSVLPEPATLTLFGLGLFGFGLIRRRKAN
jgi:hypothetical protein